MASMHGGALPSSVHKHEKTVMWLMEKIHVLENIHCSGMGYSPISCQFSVHESNKISVNRNIHKTRLCIDRFTKVL